MFGVDIAVLCYLLGLLELSQLDALYFLIVVMLLLVKAGLLGF